MKYAALFALLITCAFTSGEIHGQSALLSLSFSPNVIEVGSPAVIDLLINCQVESCAAADISVEFDPDALHIDDIALGEFPTQSGNSAYMLEHQVDDDAATFTLRYITIDGGYPATTGMGILAHITITGLAEGNSELRFVKASIAPLDGEPVFTPQTSPGTVTVRPRQTFRTLAVQAEAIDPDQITVSSPVTENMIVSETVEGQTLFVDVNLGSNSQPALKIDAPGHLSCTTDGSQDRQITLRAGDVNGDGTIDIQDAATIGIAATENQQAETDLNHDGVVNVFDLIHVGRNYGLSSGEC